MVENCSVALDVIREPLFSSQVDEEVMYLLNNSLALS